MFALSPILTIKHYIITSVTEWLIGGHSSSLTTIENLYILQDSLALSMLSMVNHQSEPNQPAQDCVENHGLQVGDLGTTHPLPYNCHIAPKFH